MDQYRVYGNPIKQSRSPYIHKAFAQSTEQILCYEGELVPNDEFETHVKRFIQMGGNGANVTMPFKEQALALCDQLSERATLAGAVNTLSFKNGQILGDNTDGVGLVRDLINQQVGLKNKKILIIGAGGAVKGVILPLLEQRPHSIHIANRTVSKAQNLCEQFNAKSLSASSFTDIKKQEYDLIINATSASLTGEIPALPVDIITPKTACYDMVYGNTLTPFLRWAQQQGAAKVIDGLGMLVEQAAESFYIWRHVMPETQSVLQALRIKLNHEK